MKMTTELNKLNETMNASHFLSQMAESDNLTIKTNKRINTSLQQLVTLAKLKEKTFQRLRTA